MSTNNVIAEPPANHNMSAIGIILISVAAGSIGQLVVKQAMNGIGKVDLSVDTLTKMATSPVLWVGLVIYGLSALFWLLALMRADLSFAYPFLSLTYIAVLIGGATLLHEQIRAGRLVGFVIIIIGLLVIARSEARSTEGTAPPP